MKAMILAAGLGTRLRPLTNNTPKALLLVDGRPLIHYSLMLLKKHGIRDIVINLHYLGDLIQKELGDGSKFGLKILYSWEPKILGTGGGVRKAAHFLEGESFFVLNSDVLIDADLKTLYAQHQRKKSLATMVLREKKPEDTFTPVWVSKTGAIVGIGDNPAVSKKTNVRACHFTGIHFMESKFLGYLPPEGEACIIRQAYLPAIAAGEKISAHFYDGYWNDLGTMDRLRQAENDLKSGKVRFSYL